MKNYSADKIRNMALLGHHGSGKTTLAEALLYTTGAISKAGSVEEKNTVSDYDKEEKTRQVSISTSVIPVEWKDHKYNVLDTPGYFDFVGEVDSALRVARGAIITMDASAGFEVGAEKAWKYTRRKNLPTLLFVNKMDKENINFTKLVEELRTQLGKQVVPFCIPIGKGEEFEGFVNIVDMKARIYDGTSCKDAEIWPEKAEKVDQFREMLVESVAESDDELMEKYFNGESFTEEEIHKGLRKGVIEGTLVPVLCGSATKNVGVHTLLDMIWDYLPSPTDMQMPFGINPKTEEEIERKIDKDEPFSAVVFKTIVDPYVGKMSLFKVRSGSLKKDDEIYNVNTETTEKVNTLFLLRGKEQVSVDSVSAGDIGVVAKLNDTHTGNTLCAKDALIKYREIPFTQPTYFMAINPKSKNDEDKLSSALTKILDEDKTICAERKSETKQLLLGTQGNLHLEVIKNKLENLYGVHIDIEDPRIVYRETIKGQADVQGKHKKQSGGAGQYGDVHIKFEPCEEDFVFEEKIFGGSVPKSYIPAVEKGLVDSLKKGVLAGYPVVNVKAILHDGSYHAVDSSEMAFKTAASIAFKKGMKEANPVLLEPVMRVEVLVPEEYMGDVMGDMNKRRGRILGMEQQKDGSQLVIAEAPEAELLTYTVDLKSMTQARASFTLKFERYEEVPGMIADKVIGEAHQEN
ncbi:MAG: elongation factor G [Tissierellales bacterium]|jgi:elongation factor G|nr:elongation factor G [Tissierellales bacterium]